MNVHIITGGASGAALAASATLGAAAHSVNHDPLLLVPAILSAAAAFGGFGVAAVSYWRHRNDVSSLDTHEQHDDERFTALEQLIVPVYTKILGQAPTQEWVKGEPPKQAG